MPENAGQLDDSAADAVPPRLMTMLEVCDVADVSLNTVIREVKRGRLVATRIGRSTRFAVTDVREWLRGRRDLRYLYREHRGGGR